jgi:putative ABC transport system substrate-binding protein
MHSMTIEIPSGALDARGGAILGRMRLGFLCILVLAGLSFHCTAPAQEAVTLLLSEDGGAYAEFATYLSDALGPGGAKATGVRVNTLNLAKGDELARGGNGQMVVAVGTPAMAAVARKLPNVPVLNVLVPRASFRSLARTSPRTQDSRFFSAVFFDQPWARQFSLIRHALPGRRVGILLGKDSAELHATLMAAARDAQMVASIEMVTDEADLLPALKRLLPNSDALLAVPDATIYNRSNIATILLTSYRAKVPLFGFSASYVRAGALAAVYSHPWQIAHQAAEIIQNLIAGGGGLPPPQSPRYFSVNVNAQVRTSLELSMDDEAQLLQKLKQLPEGVP